MKAYKEDVKNFNPDYLFHLGAYTDLEFCEKNADDTYLTNTTSVENAVYIANELNIPILYISTAGIFDGGKEKYDDWDQPNPLGHYARSKYAGELFIKENAKNYLEDAIKLASSGSFGHAVGLLILGRSYQSTNVVYLKGIYHYQANTKFFETEPISQPFFQLSLRYLSPSIKSKYTPKSWSTSI